MFSTKHSPYMYRTFTYKRFRLRQYDTVFVITQVERFGEVCTHCGYERKT